MKRCIYRGLIVVLAGVSLPLKADEAGVDNLQDFFLKGHLGGQLRLYDFNRSYGDSNPSHPSSHALAGALLLDGTTASLNGFSLATSLATVSDLGSRDHNPKRVDTTLMGTKSYLNAVTQGYLQYKNQWMTFRGGLQYLDTPWMSRSDIRIVPASYSALSLTVSPVKNLDISLIRSFSWRSRVSSGYHDDNLYYPANYRGNQLYGGANKLSGDARSAGGTYAVGVSYAHDGLKARGWYYDFQNFGRLSYLDGSYTFRTGTGFDPVLGAQFAYETSGTHNRLTGPEVAINRVSGSQVKSRAWGVDLGLLIPNGRIDVAYNKIAQEHAVGGGALISPYTVGYASDPLYTTSMIRGLVEMGPGNAWKTKLTYDLFNRHLQVMGAYARYNTQNYGESHDLYGDLIFNFNELWGRTLNGLSLRNRWERSSGGKNNLNPGNRHFTYNRLIVTYSF